MGTAGPHHDCLHDGPRDPLITCSPGRHLYLVRGPKSRRPQPSGRPGGADCVLAPACVLRTVPGLVGACHRGWASVGRSAAPDPAALLVADGRHVSRAGAAPRARLSVWESVAADSDRRICDQEPRPHRSRACDRQHGSPDAGMTGADHGPNPGFLQSSTSTREGTHVATGASLLDNCCGGRNLDGTNTEAFDTVVLARPQRTCGSVTSNWWR